MSIAEAYDVPLTRRPLVPPSPPRAPEGMGAISRIRAMRESVLSTWGPRAYQEEIIQSRFFLRRNFIVNQPDHCDCWSWIDDGRGRDALVAFFLWQLRRRERRRYSLIVQGDISTCYRRSERAAGFGHAFNGFT